MNNAHSASEHAKELIAAGDLAEAIKSMLEHTPGADVFSKVSLLGLQSRLSRWDKLLHTGQISHEAYDKQVNSISMALLSLLGRQEKRLLIWVINLIPVFALCFLVSGILSLTQSFEGIKVGKPGLYDQQLRFPLLKIGDKTETYTFHFQTPDSQQLKLLPHMVVRRKDKSTPEFQIIEQDNLELSQQISATLEGSGRYDIIIPVQSNGNIQIDNLVLFTQKMEGEQALMHDYPLQTKDYFINKDTRIIYLLAFLACLAIMLFFQWIKN